MPIKSYTKEEAQLDRNNIFSDILKGGVFVHPTDTIYGLGCNARLSKAVTDIRSIKNRSKRPFSVIAPNKQWINDNCMVSKDAEKHIEALPGPVTLILKLKNEKTVCPETNNGLDTIGVRIPDHWFSMLVEELDVPIVTTPVNISGEHFMTSLEDVDKNIAQKIKFVIYEGEKRGRPSTIHDFSKDEIEVRER